MHITLSFVLWMTDATDIRTRSQAAPRELVVLEILPDLLPHGGTPRKLAGATGHLCKRGIRRAVLVFGEADEGMVDQITTAGGRVLRAPRRAACDPRLIWDVAAASVRVRADVVVTNFARADIYGVLGARLVGRPTIKALEGISWNERRGVIACDRVLGRLRSLVLANSEATLHAARRRGGVGRAVVIHLGLPDAGPRDSALSRKVREELGITEGTVVVGHIGGFIALRRQDSLIDAVGLAVREVPDLRLLLIGDGPLRADLARQVRSLGLDERVMMLGYRTDVDRLRHAFDVYANPAVAEGFGLATLEAMLTGIPVIVSDAGASPELVCNGRTGVVVPAGDSAALAMAIVELVRHPDRAFAIGKAGRKLALERFSVDRYADDLERAYRRVADCRRGRRPWARTSHVSRQVDE